MRVEEKKCNPHKRLLGKIFRAISQSHCPRAVYLSMNSIRKVGLHSSSLESSRAHPALDLNHICDIKTTVFIEPVALPPSLRIHESMRATILQRSALFCFHRCEPSDQGGCNRPSGSYQRCYYFLAHDRVSCCFELAGVSRNSPSFELDLFARQ